jgi:hypothetical protein
MRDYSLCGSTRRLEGTTRTASQCKRSERAASTTLDKAPHGATLSTRLHPAPCWSRFVELLTAVLPITADGQPIDRPTPLPSAVFGMIHADRSNHCQGHQNRDERTFHQASLH